MLFEVCSVLERDLLTEIRFNRCFRRSLQGDSRSMQRALRMRRALRERRSFGGPRRLMAVDELAYTVVVGHGERSRSQLLLKLAGAENVPILAVNGLAVNGALHALYSVKKCLIQSI